MLLKSICRRPGSALLALMSLTACSQALAQPPASGGEAGASPATHLSFFVLGKSWSFRQQADGEPALFDVYWFAEVFKKAGAGEVKAVMRRLAPGSEAIAFERSGDGGAVLYGHAEEAHVDSVAALDEALPNGDYRFDLETPGGTLENFVVSLGSVGEPSALPPPPRISLAQGGKPVAPEAVDPVQPLRVRWTPFTLGRADPNGISDDLIFVMLDDCRGQRAFHSGRPLAAPNPLEPDRPSASLLSFRDTEVTIPAAALAPGMRYTLKVEHARLLDTDRRQGVVGMTTWAVTSYLDVATRGRSEGGSLECRRPEE